MVEIDPTLGVLVAAAVLVGITAVAICSKPSPVKHSKIAQASSVPAPTESHSQAKPKRRTRSKPKSKSSKSKTDENTDKVVLESDVGENKIENTHVRFVADDQSGKDEKNSKGKGGNKQHATIVEQSSTINSIVEPIDSSDTDSSDDEEVSRPVESPKRPANLDFDIITPPTTQVTPFTQNDGWAVVEDKRKNKKKSDDAPEPVVAEAYLVSPVVANVDVPCAPVIDNVSSEILVDVKKLGLLIGAKGVTRIAIQNATGTNIQMPKADKDAVGPLSITVSGTAVGVNKAITAMNELCIKGYCGLLASDDFQESYVAAHPKYLPDIIGKGGATIKALNAHTGVKITIPPAVSKTPNADGKVSKVKIGLAGSKEKVSLARSLIKDLMKYYHTPITHPNLTHCEMEIASNYFNFIIGTKGSEIKHIQNSYKVSVHIPDGDSACPNVVIVGTESAVLLARKHIEKIIDRVNGISQVSGSEDAGAESNTQDNEVTAAPKTVGESASVGGAWVEEGSKSVQQAAVELTEESWVSDYVPPASIIADISPVLPQSSNFTSVPIPDTSASTPVVESKPLTSSAWNNIFDKW